MIEKYKVITSSFFLVITLLSLLFLIFKIYQYGQDLLALISAGDAFRFIVIGTGVYSISLLILPKIYQYYLEAISNRNISYRAVCRIYGVSNINKYLPGNIFHFLGRQALANEINSQQYEVAMASTAEIIYLVITSFLLSVLFLLVFSLDISGLTDIPAMLITIIPIFLILLLIALRLIKSKGKNRYLKSLRSTSGNFIIFKAISAYALFFLISSLIFLWIIIGNTSVNIYYLTNIMFAYIFSWLVGYVVPGAPAGFGVRETCLYLILEGIMPSSVILVGALIMRMINTLGDLLFFLYAKNLKI